MRCTRLFILTLAIALLSCADSTATSGSWRVEIGLLVPELSRIQAVVIPESIFVGRPIRVTVNTVGSSTCVRPAGVVVEGSGTRVQTLTPLDSVGVGMSCTDDLAQHSHPVTLTFSQAGSATIRVRGYVRGTDLVRRIETIQAQVTVRP